MPDTANPTATAAAYQPIYDADGHAADAAAVARDTSNARLMAAAASMYSAAKDLMAAYASGNILRIADARRQLGAILCTIDNGDA